MNHLDPSPRQRDSLADASPPDAEVVANAGGSNEKSIFGGPMTNLAADAAWSPHGKAIAGVMFDQTGNSISTLISIDPSTGSQTISTPPYTGVTNASWLPNGKALASRLFAKRLEKPGAVRRRLLSILGAATFPVSNRAP